MILGFQVFPTRVIAEVISGHYICLDERMIAESALNRELEWAEIPDSGYQSGGYGLVFYETYLPNFEAKRAKAAIANYREQLGV